MDHRSRRSRKAFSWNRQRRGLGRTRNTVIGYNILHASPRQILKTAAVVCLQHHERWDGSGYPNGLAGEKIELMGRIVCLADVFDAVSNPRLYKPAWPAHEVRAYIQEQRGKQFDPLLVDLFIRDFDEFAAMKDESAGG